MFTTLRRWFIRTPPAAVEATYIALVAAARNPFFYTTTKVPDTLDGRFEMIVLHLFLLERRVLFIEGGLTPPSTPAAARLAMEGYAANTATTPSERTEFARMLSEAFLRDMDSSLRELGVADTGVAHRIKKMAKSYHGHLQAYTAAMGDTTLLRAALARNVYGTVAEGDVNALARLADYVEATSNHLAATDVAVILRGDYAWPSPTPLE